MIQRLAAFAVLFVIPRAIADGNAVFLIVGAVLIGAGILIGGNP